MADPLGRKHQIDRIPKNRWQVNNVADYVMKNELKNFNKKPSSSHIYFDAYSLVYGSEEAYKMLDKARNK